MTAHFRFLPKHTRACAFLIYNNARTRTRAFLCFITYFTLYPSKTLKNPQKCPFFKCLIFSTLQRKCIFSCIFLQKYLVISKKSSTFALAFEKQVSFDFLPETRTLKFRFSNEDLIFLRQTEENIFERLIQLV